MVIASNTGGWSMVRRGGMAFSVLRTIERAGSYFMCHRRIPTMSERKRHDLENWDEFEDRLRSLKEEYPPPRSLLFRGLEDDRYKLTTTLERHGNSGMSFADYYRLTSRVRPQIESFTGRKWNVPEFPEYLTWLDENDSLGLFNEFPAYDYMVYLRHHGFPSPLLDWTASPYVAAYFAFRGITADVEHGRQKQKVAICVFCKDPKGFTHGSSSEPEIRRIGPYVQSHQRHFLQQSDYTVCIVRDVGKRSNPGDAPVQRADIAQLDRPIKSGQHSWRYASHEQVFARDDSSQDLLWKFCIPITERRKVQKMLDAYNLNAFSLFGSEESLMETMALRELHFREAVL